MNISVGIVGLPNVGKSTLFNALLKKQIANVANYPFCTIEPNVGVIEVPDERLPVLAKIVNTQKIVSAIIEFYDIAGLVKGASKGEGLGNKFLSHIREVSVIVHVVRFFEDNDIIHVSPIINSKDDIQVIDTELTLADLATLEKQVAPRMNASKEEVFRYEVIKKVKEKLNSGIPIRKMQLGNDEKDALKPLSLLTIKPVLYLFNVSEKQLEDYKNTEDKIKELLNSINENSEFLFLSAKLENEVLSLNETEQKEYLSQYNLSDIGLKRFIKKSYFLLGLISYLTAGEKEVRAWTIKNGTNACKAAGVIHSDFEKHFIKADIIPYLMFVESQGWIRAKELGKVQTVSRDYIMKDGDVVDFKIGT